MDSIYVSCPPKPSPRILEKERERECERERDRLRSGQACLGCRRRKNRCDGVRPECGFCRKKRLGCKYADRHDSVDYSYITHLQEKTRKLERDLERSRAGITDTIESDSVATSVEDNAIPPNIPSHVMSSSLPTSALDKERPSFSQSVISEDESDRSEEEFLDVVEFDEAPVYQVLADFGYMPYKNRPAKKRSASISRADMRTKFRKGGVIRGSAELRQDDYTLPSREQAENLVDLFFDHVFPLYPYLHEPTFRNRFAATYDSTGPLDLPWQATLNFVFAFGVDYLDLPLSDIYELSQTFHRRGAELILSVCFEVGTVEVVQALLLLTGHLQSNMQLNKCWVSMGCIVRTAQALGLYLDPTDWNISFIEKEMRKRLWWGIYSLDRFISLKHGRPPAVTTESLPVGPPATVSDDQITHTGIKQCNGSNAPSPIHFFNAMVQLAHIMETMLVSVIKDTPWLLPGGRSGTTSGAYESNSMHLNIQVGLVVEQEGKLAMWLSGLPMHLRLQSVDSSDPTFFKLTEKEKERLQTQRRMLRARYLHTRLMVHRQNLISIIKHDSERIDISDDGFLKSVVMASIHQCVQCACEIVPLVRENADSKAMGPWWYNVQFIFTALGTLLAVQSRASISSYIDHEAVNEAIDMALDYLTFIGDVSPVTTRCRRYFESHRNLIYSKRSPLDHAIITNMQIPASVRSTLGAPLDVNITQASKLVPDSNSNRYYGSEDNFDSSFVETMAGLSDDIFLEPLLPDIDFELFAI